MVTAEWEGLDRRLAALEKRIDDLLSDKDAPEDPKSDAEPYVTVEQINAENYRRQHTECQEVLKRIARHSELLEEQLQSAQEHIRQLQGDLAMANKDAEEAKLDLKRTARKLDEAREQSAKRSEKLRTIAQVINPSEYYTPGSI